jgi:hypothetical protein
VTSTEIKPSEIKSSDPDIRFLNSAGSSAALATETIPRDSRWKQDNVSAISHDHMQQIKGMVDHLQGSIEKMATAFSKVARLFQTLGGFKDSRDLIPEAWDKKVGNAITKKLNEYKQHVEKNLIPALESVRKRFAGQTFTKTSETPKPLLLISVPSEKAGKVPSFDTLKKSVASSCAASGVVRCTPLGEARMVLERGQGDKAQRVELVYRTPYKVDLYVNGKRRGSLWNDDAAKLAKRLAEGKPVKFKKEQHYTEFTVV